MDIEKPLYARVPSSKSSSNTGVTLRWSNIAYSVASSEKGGEERKVLLHPMMGAAYPKELLAVMGSSGAGG